VGLGERRKGNKQPKPLKKKFRNNKVFVWNRSFRAPFHKTFPQQWPENRKPPPTQPLPGKKPKINRKDPQIWRSTGTTLNPIPPLLPFPDGEELEKISGPIKLGIVNKKNGVLIPFGFSPDIFTMHGLVAGRTGTGKSWGNIPLLQQLIINGLKFGVNRLVPDVKLFYRILLSNKLLTVSFFA
jgi:hypothetical protein